MANKLITPAQMVKELVEKAEEYAGEHGCDANEVAIVGAMFLGGIGLAEIARKLIEDNGEQSPSS